jgi:hypothetical protein
LVDQFIIHIVNEEYSLAHEMFSIEAKKGASISKLKEFQEGANAALFHNYESNVITNIHTSSSITTNPNKPPGKYVSLSGFVIYSDGYQGNLAVTLYKERGQWKIYNFNITCPPEKFESYLQPSS